jgi:mannose/fructose/N-acetylgalactosamine-specific phosphotransferase system component IID
VSSLSDVLTLVCLAYTTLPSCPSRNDLTSCATILGLVLLGVLVLDVLDVLTTLGDLPFDLCLPLLVIENVLCIDDGEIL